MRGVRAIRKGSLVGDFPVFFAVVSIVGFVRLYFSAGRLWLGYTACGLRLLDLVLNFLSAPNLNYKEITGLRHLTAFGGETISVAEGTENPWIKVSELSSLFLLAFVVDASVTLWCRGHRASAVALRSLGDALYSSFWWQPPIQHC